MTFDLAVQIVLMKEGFQSDHKEDSGGLTRYGISSGSFPNEDVANMTIHRAKELYKKHYWDMCECDDLPAWIRLLIFDCAVNQGVSRAIIFLQRSLGVTQDGIIGPNTINAAKHAGPKEVLSDYALRRLDAYLKHPKWAVFGKGWMRRLFEISLFAMMSAPGDSIKRSDLN